MCGAALSCPRRVTACGAASRPVPPPADLSGRVDQVQELQLVEVADRAQRRTWNEMMTREHPRATALSARLRARLPGRTALRRLSPDAGGARLLRWLGPRFAGAKALSRGGPELLPHPALGELPQPDLEGAPLAATECSLDLTLLVHARAMARDMYVCSVHFAEQRQAAPGRFSLLPLLPFFFRSSPLYAAASFRRNGSRSNWRTRAPATLAPASCAASPANRSGPPSPLSTRRASACSASWRTSASSLRSRSAARCTQPGPGPANGLLCRRSVRFASASPATKFVSCHQHRMRVQCLAAPRWHFLAFPPRRLPRPLAKADPLEIRTSNPSKLPGFTGPRH